jgi:uncharacterized protein
MGIDFLFFAHEIEVGAMAVALEKELGLLEGESFVHPDAELRPKPVIDGYGLFAGKFIPAHSTIILWACHTFVSFEWLRQQPRKIQENAIQLTDDFFTYGVREKADFINHSCEPNCGLVGQVQIVTLEDVKKDDELCIDYAMLHCTPICEFPCCCGSAFCRKQVTGDDWMHEELQNRYRGYFCSAVQSRINSQSSVKVVSIR